jgi:hypothetical protein
MAWPRRIYCAMNSIGVYYTDNFVDPSIQPIWTALNTGLGNLNCIEFHLDPFDQANIQYVLTSEPKIYRREYGGAWTVILDPADVHVLLGGNLTNIYITGFCTDSVNDGRLWAVVNEGWTRVTFIRSDDRGDNWYVTNTPGMGVYYGGLTIRAYDNLLVYSGLYGLTHQIYLSDDTGASWTDIANFATPSQAIALHPPLNAFYFTKGSGPKQFCEYVFGIGWTDIQDLIVLRFDGMLFDPLDDLHQRAIYNYKLYVTTDDWANKSDSGTITGNPTAFADWGGAAPLDIDQMLVVMSIDVGTSQYHHCGVLEGEGDTTAVGISGANCNTPPYIDSIPDDDGIVCVSGLAPLRESQGVIYTNAVAMPGYSDTGDERGVPMPGDRGDWDAKNYPLRHANDIDLVTGIHHTLGTDPGQASPGDHTHALDDLSDVNAPAPNDLDVLSWDDGAGEWVPVAPGGVIADHDHSGDAGDGGQFDAQNLLSTGANDGDVLTSDGAGNSAWEAPAGGAMALDDLTDVNAPAPSDQDVLTWDNVAGEWISQAPSGGVDANAIHVNQANEISGIANKATPDSADMLVIEDSADGNNKKMIAVGSLPAGMVIPISGALTVYLNTNFV